MGRTKSHRQSLTCCSIKVSLQSGDFSCFYEHYKFQKNILPEHNPGIPEPFLYAARQSVFWSLQAVIPHLNAKTLTDHMHVNACGRVPIKLYLQMQVVGQMRPGGSLTSQSAGEEDAMEESFHDDI